MSIAKSMTGTRGSSLTRGRLWTPRDIFRGAAVPLGAWYDPTDFSSMFQDVAGTIPVTAAGQSVGMLRDKSGNGLHLTAAGDNSTRPILETDGRTFCLVFDGLDDVLYRTSAQFYNAALPIAFSMSMIANRVNGTGDQRYFSEGSNGTDQPVYLFQSNSASPTTLSMFIRNAGGVGLINTTGKGLAYDNVRRTSGFIDNLGDLRFRVDGVETGSSTYTRSGDFSQLNRTAVGAMVRAGAASFASFRLFGLIIVASAKAQEVAPKMEKYLRRNL